MYKLNLAEDPTGRSKAVSFNFAIIKELKTGHLSYLDTSATSCNSVILKVPHIANVWKGEGLGTNKGSNRVTIKEITSCLKTYL